MKCPHCGSWNSDRNDGFCKSCRRKLPVFAARTVEPEPATRDEVPSTRSFDSPREYQAPFQTYLLPNILILFACLPLGIMGIIQATKAQRQLNLGNQAQAEHAAASARRVFLLGLGYLVLSVVFGVGVVVYTIVVGA